MSTSDEECPVCQETVCNPSQPTPCCKKIICQRCLSQSFRFRPHCPYCRSPLNNPLPPNRRTHMRALILPNNFETGHSRHVGSNIQNLLGQLRNSQTQQTDIANAAPAPAAQNQAPPPLINFSQPVPMPRIQRPNVITALQPTVVTAAPSYLGVDLDSLPPAPGPLVPNPVPQPASVSAGLSGYIQAGSASLLPNPGLSQDILPADSWFNTFECPYCQSRGLDEIQLRNHCNDFHASDLRSVVCPVCVATPHGNPQYYSRNFIGHLNLRHCYYMDDITNLQQSDEVNMQCAILASIKEKF